MKTLVTHAPRHRTAAGSTNAGTQPPIAQAVLGTRPTPPPCPPPQRAQQGTARMPFCTGRQRTACIPAPGRPPQSSLRPADTRRHGCPTQNAMHHVAWCTWHGAAQGPAYSSRLSQAEPPPLGREGPGAPPPAAGKFGPGPARPLPIRGQGARGRVRWRLGKAAADTLLPSTGHSAAKGPSGPAPACLHLGPKHQQKALHTHAVPAHLTNSGHGRKGEFNNQSLIIRGCACDPTPPKPSSFIVIIHCWQDHHQRLPPQLWQKGEGLYGLTD